jgi:thioredoxin
MRRLQLKSSVRRCRSCSICGRQWCGPCRMVAPVLEELANEMAGRVRVAKVNVDENPATASRFQVRSIPTLLVLKGGQEMERIVGVQPKDEIIRRLERVIA